MRQQDLYLRITLLVECCCKILSSMQALNETWREKLYDEQIEALKVKRKEDERKSLESKMSNYRYWVPHIFV